MCVCGGGGGWVGGVCVYCIHIDSRFIVGVDLCLCVHVCVCTCGRLVYKSDII